MSARVRDGAARLLASATVGLPGRYADWGRAVRAELAAIDDPGERRTFARSAAAMAFVRGAAHWLVLPVVAGVVSGVAAIVASRVQLDGAASPGILGVTVPVPGLLILLVALVAGGVGRSFGFGLIGGLVSIGWCFVAVLAVSASEGLVWMDRHGVFVLDADPPKQAVTDIEVMLDLLTTGMWLGHVMVWLVAALVGAALGAGVSALAARRARLA